MKKLKDLTKAQLDEISHQIADAFYDYRYDPVESGLRKYIGSRENMFIYMNAIVRAAYKTGIPRSGITGRSGSTERIHINALLKKCPKDMPIR